MFAQERRKTQRYRQSDLLWVDKKRLLVKLFLPKCWNQRKVKKEQEWVGFKQTCLICCSVFKHWRSRFLFGKQFIDYLSVVFAERLLLILVRMTFRWRHQMIRESSNDLVFCQCHSKIQCILNDWVGCRLSACWSSCRRDQANCFSEWTLENWHQSTCSLWIQQTIKSRFPFLIITCVASFRSGEYQPRLVHSKSWKEG